jgi:putative glutamine amidotransferase
MKPRIGITPCSRIDDYVASVERAGGQPAVLSNDDDPVAVLETIDGLLLTGGLDVDPRFYGEAPHATTATAPERDRFEIPLTRAAIARDVPLLAICRGVQVLNVAAGGSLIQDIPSAIPSTLDHAIDTPKNHPAHNVRVTAGTRLFELLGAEQRTVNSRHHQAVADVASEFVVSAVSADGVVEAIEKPDANYCIGVQWHPENFWTTGEFSSLFDSFVQAARHRVADRGD